MEPISLRTPLALLLISLGAIAAVWWWLATPITLARAPIDPNAKLQCVSYAPFRGDADAAAARPRDIAPEQIAQDLAQLAKISDCVRTYSIENGLDQVPALAAKVGLKVIQGIWLGSNRLKNSAQISTVVGLDQGNIPDVITSRRGRQRGAAARRDDRRPISPPPSARSKRRSPFPSPMPMCGNSGCATAKSMTPSISSPSTSCLIGKTFRSAPNMPPPMSMPSAGGWRWRFPGKEILIGETGWPSEGRMREGALPSRTNQARVVSEILDLAKQENFRVNLIEAYDQPWKRQLEGTVGGYWGLFDSVQRALKYPPGEAISNFPLWKLQMGCGMALSVLVFWRGLADLAAPALDAAAGVLDRGRNFRDHGRNSASASPPTRCSMKATASAAGCDGARCWPPAIASPLLCANALMSGRSLPTFLELLGPRDDRTRSVLTMHARSRAGRDHADRHRDRARLRVRPALQGFSVCRADHGGGAVRDPDAAQSPAGGRAPDRGGGICRAVGGCRRSTPGSTKGRTTGSRCGPARSISCSRVTLWQARAVQIPK